jgi:anti-anti-sigma factor
METTRPVVVKHVPEKLGAKESHVFFRDVQPLVTMDRPQIVFDLSRVRQFDAAGVEMLLECMSEVMKRDGDLKLASLSPEAAVILELTRTDRLFEIYRTAADAVRSFTRYMPHAMRNQPFGSSDAAGIANSPGSAPSRPQPKTDAA